MTHLLYLGNIKFQALANFMVEFRSPVEEEASHVLVLSVGSSNLKRSGARIVLKGPDDILIEQSLCFSINANNNQSE